MAKISKEEYEVLKGLDDKWKWIARDSDTILWVYEKEPRKYENCWDELSGDCEIVGSDLFRFIQWDDEEPRRIDELLDDHESKHKKLEEAAILAEGWGSIFRDLSKKYGESSETDSANVDKDSVERHKELLQEIHDLYKRKNRDYGDSFEESLDDDGLLALKVRLGDKYRRFSTLINQAQQVDDESMRDTLVDLANYTLMGVMWMDKQEEEK